MTSVKFHHRVFAVIVDLFTGFCLGLIMSHSAGYYFAGRAEVMLKIGCPESIWKGTIPFLMGIIGPLTYVLPLALYLVLLTEPLFNISLGKLIFSLKIVSHKNRPVSFKQRWIRHIIKTSPLWIIISGLILGNWQLALTSLITALILSVGFFGIISSKHKTLHDHLAKTSVIYISNR